MMTHMLARVRPSDHERTAPMPGDDVLPTADVVMDRGFTVPGTPAQVWPWIAQLGKGRGRWYLPATLERLLPRAGRGLRHIEPRWQDLHKGDVVPDYGRDESFTVVEVDPPRVLVYYSERGQLTITWAISLDEDPGNATATRVRLRLRCAGVKHLWLVRTGGELIDLLTILGMAAGLAERTRNL